jgi:large subunit ribosomal protein L13
VDCGDNVIVINSEKSTLQVTKWTKRLTSVTGYPGGQRTLTAKVLQAKKPCIISSRESCKGMLPKNKLGAELLEI